MPVSKLNGKIAWVTGASSGIGAATAMALAAEGATVIVTARRLQRLDAVVDRIRGGGSEALAIVADVTSQDEVASAVEHIMRAYGRLDILLCCAGIGVAAPFANTDIAEYKPMVEVNVLGTLYPICAALPSMKSKGSGHVVVVSSGTGRYIHPSVVYSGTKHAVSAMAESLRREIGKDGIRVTCIEPGAVKTEFTSHMRADVREAVERRLGDMEQLESEDIAGAIVFAVTRPSRVNVNILTIYPTEQA